MEYLRKSKSQKDIENTKNLYNNILSIPIFNSRQHALRYKPLVQRNKMDLGVHIKTILKFKEKNNELLSRNNHLSNLINYCLIEKQIEEQKIIKKETFDLPKIMLNKELPWLQKNNENKGGIDNKKLNKSSSAVIVKKRNEIQSKNKYTIKGSKCLTIPAERDIQNFSQNIKEYIISKVNQKTIKEDINQKLKQRYKEILNSDTNFMETNFESKVLGNIKVFGVVDGNGEYGSFISKIIKNYFIKYLKNTIFPITYDQDNYFSILTTLFLQCNNFLKKISYVSERNWSTEDIISKEIQKENTAMENKRKKEENLRLNKIKEMKKKAEEEEKLLDQKLEEDRINKLKMFTERTKKEQESVIKTMKNSNVIDFSVFQIDKDNINTFTDIENLINSHQNTNNFKVKQQLEYIHKYLLEKNINLKNTVEELTKKEAQRLEIEIKNFKETRKDLIKNVRKESIDIDKKDKDKNMNLDLDNYCTNLPNINPPIKVDCNESGASALIVLMVNDDKSTKLFCGSIGSCKSLIFTNDKSYVLSLPSTTFQKFEIERIKTSERGYIDESENYDKKIKSSSDFVNSPPFLFFPYDISEVSNNENYSKTIRKVTINNDVVKRGLNVTRAFGHFFWERMGIIANPVIGYKDLSKANYKFIVIGTIGFWKYFRNEDEIREKVKKHYYEGNYFGACKELETIARKRKATYKRNHNEPDDDITVMVVFLDNEHNM